jgi:hypothetical protein
MDLWDAIIATLSAAFGGSDAVEKLCPNLNAR